MTSAFEFYNQNRNRDQGMTSNDVGNGPTTSTPLPQSTLFSSNAGEGPSAENIFLSPVRSVVKKAKKKVANSKITGTKIIKQKKKKQLENLKNALDCIPGAVEITVIENGRVVSEYQSPSIPSTSQSSLSPQMEREEPEEFEKMSSEDASGGSNASDVLKPESKRKMDKEEPIEMPKQKRLRTIKRVEDTPLRGKCMLGWIVSPMNVDQFLEKYWEKQPLFISRSYPQFYDGVCSKDDLDAVFRDTSIRVGKNVTISNYKKGKRIDQEMDCRATPTIVWDAYDRGNSIRIMNPQTYVPNIGFMVAKLQEYFRCMVGVNSYLTPPGCQGFAPHYDDIEAFVLQLEGEKDWKIYPPRSDSETLPRFSSRNFKEDELGEPLIELTLKAGDLLYFPRGFIHQARSVPDQHSLHITISTYQLNTWGDFLKKVLPMAIDRAIDSDKSLRKGLPLSFLDRFGLINNAEENPERQNMIDQAQELIRKVMENCPWDAAADLMGKKFVQTQFPPSCEYVDKETWHQLNENYTKVYVKLITANACRVVEEEAEDGSKTLVFYHSLHNNEEPNDDEQPGLAITSDELAVLKKLKEKYPRYCRYRDIASSVPSREAIQPLLADLAARGILSVKFFNDEQPSPAAPEH